MSVGAVNKQTGERIPTAGMPPVDSVLSGTSTNPVQNKVVKEALDGKQDTLTFDDTPTDGSNNPVKSNGIYDALATKADTDMVAADFNAGTSYTAGNYCIYDGKFYKFKANHSGAWSSADVDEVKITGELSALKSGLTDRAKVCFINVPSDKRDVNGFLGYVFSTIITEQASGSYVVYGAWINHDFYTGIVYKVTNDTAIGIINYGASAQNMALYSACYKTGVYSDYKTVQYVS